MFLGLKYDASARVILGLKIFISDVYPFCQINSTFFEFFA